MSFDKIFDLTAGVYFHFLIILSCSSLLDEFVHLINLTRNLINLINLTDAIILVYTEYMVS